MNEIRLNQEAEQDLGEIKRHISKKLRNPLPPSVLIMSAEGAGFEESEHWYDHLEKHIGWKSLGKVLCGYVTQPGDVEGKQELADAFELGKSIR